MGRAFFHSRLQRQFFWPYGILLIALSAILLLVISTDMTRTLNESSQDLITQLAITLNTQIDEQIQGMDQLSRQVIYSDEIINEFLHPREQLSSLFLPLERRRVISNGMYTILEPVITQYNQLSIVDTSTGNYIGIGMYPHQTLLAERELWETDWIRQTLDAAGEIYIVPAHQEKWRESGRTVFSVARAFRSGSDPDGAYIGIVEVPCDTSFLDTLFRDALRENEYVEKLFLYAQDGSVLYASHPEEADVYRQQPEQLAAGGAEGSRKGLIGSARSDLTGWRIVMQGDRSKIRSSLSSVSTSIGLFIIMATVASLLISYYLSRKLSRPIRQIHDSISHLQVNDHSIQAVAAPDARENELEQLRDTFDVLCSRLDDAINEVALAHTCELESRVAALEAQINPHFLYNTFAMIQTMADSNAGDEISAVCGDLSQLLRYAVNSSNTPSTVSSEIGSCSLYLGVMYRRHFTQLSFSINMDPELEQRPMPRMVLQPLVENCFKHGLQHSENWKIDIRAVQEADCWYIAVSDNGVGFREDVIRQVKQQLNAQPRLIQGEGTKHIGLVNIGIRMKLFFGDDVIFDIYNLPEGGCCVRLGAKGGNAVE